MESVTKGKSVGESSNPRKGSGEGRVSKEKSVDQNYPFTVQILRGIRILRNSKPPSPPKGDLSDEIFQKMERFETVVKQKNQMDCRNPNPPLRCSDQLALFALELTIVDQEKLEGRNLRCIVTVDYRQASEDIYNGKLPTNGTATGDCIVLQLTGPGNFISAGEQAVFAVSLVDESESVAAPLVTHRCNPYCRVAYKSCGSYPYYQEDLGHAFQSGLLFTWKWDHEKEDMENYVHSVDLLDHIWCMQRQYLYFNGKLHTGGRKLPDNYGCSLELMYTAFEDAVVAKVNVVLVKPSPKICSCGCGLVITAHIITSEDCEDLEFYGEGILLFRKDQCENQTTSPPPKEIELKLSRSFVTIPAPTIDPVTILKVVLWERKVGGSPRFPYDGNTKKITSIGAEIASASFATQTSGQINKAMSLSVDCADCESEIASKVEVTVKWM